MIYTNQYLTDFVGNNWMALIIGYGVCRAIFPQSKILTALGEGFARMFSVFRNNPGAGESADSKRIKANG